jgi:hypothetical protein
LLWPTGTPLAASFSEFVDPHPAPGNQFGTHVVPLSTGNVVITSPCDDAGGTDAGAAYLFNGATGALISTLRGSTAGDSVASGGVTALANGNYVVHSPKWNNGFVAKAGAVTWGSGTTGVAGVVSAANSLVGSYARDEVGGVHYDAFTGKVGVTPLSNGNFVVTSPNWDNGAVVDAGAVTWGSGVTGVTGGISAANSLIGSRNNDKLGSDGVTPLSNGNYVVASSQWDNGTVSDVGAATWGSGTTGVKGAVSAANSLVGSTAGDDVGFRGVTPLANGNYVVNSLRWHSRLGAVTWGSGVTGVTGVVSAVNSLVGSKADDLVGDGGVTALTNGNYVVASPYWDNGAIVDAGAVTWGSGATGVSGVVSAANSLVGSTVSDMVGDGFLRTLTNGNYVVESPNWDNGSVVDAGAVTWGSGTTGVSGVVSAANSLVGSTAGDRVSGGNVVALTNGNYVVVSYEWDNGAIVDAGAATWGSGTTGVSGVISAANSLVGSTAGDWVSSGGVIALSNGNYVVASPNWNYGGAVTWGDGTAATTGVVSAANSLVGCGWSWVTALTNGNYVVANPVWDNGGVAQAGAVTWCGGTAAATGAVSAANSLVGTTSYDQVGMGGVKALSSGNYLVVSSSWVKEGSNVGAATWGSGTTGVSGAVSAANSLIGTGASGFGATRWMTALANGSYVVANPGWDNGAIVNAGAATWGDGTTGVSGEISAANSLVGTTANTNLQPIVADDVNGTFIAPFPAEGGGRVRVGPTPGGTTAINGAGSTAFALEGARPNPTSGIGLHVAFTLPTGADARLQLLDVSGRRVLEREVGSLGAGRHTVNLAAGRKVVPGVYWVRLVQGANQRTARVAVIE